MKGKSSPRGMRKDFNREGCERLPPRWRRLLGGSMLCFASMLLASGALAQVTFERLLNSAREPQNWMTYSGDYSGKRFSALDQIKTANAHSLVAKWVYQTGATGKLETTPLVVDGTLYATAQDDRAFALDARTGRPIWMYQRQLPGDIRPCCGRVNRGMAILGDKVFLGTLDAHVIALDAKTGNVVWDVAAADYRTGHSFTVSPLAVKNLIVIGVSGGEYGVRGFVDAYDAMTGERKWRFYTVPGPGEPGHESWEGNSWKVGGAPAWNTGTYDAATNQIFWPTGNPAPSNRGEGRAGDNLYSNSLLALNADTGKMNWYFQFTKHDEHDWDATQVPVMIDTGGRHLIAQANRNGFFYVLDRTTGKLVSANAYGKITWIAHAPGTHGLSGRARNYKLHGSGLQSEDQSVLRHRAGPVRHFQHRSTAVRGGPRLLWQRLFSFGGGQALPWISQGDRSGDRTGEMEV